MPIPYSAAMPSALDLSGSYTVRVTAVDPSTGDRVPGITVSDLAMYIDNVGDGELAELGFGPYMLVPGPGA